jgi:hypothetical protein
MRRSLSYNSPGFFLLISTKKFCSKQKRNLRTLRDKMGENKMILATSVLLLGVLPSLNAEVVQEAKLSSPSSVKGFHYLQKIMVEDHTYLYFMTLYNPRCNVLLHDPNCPCSKPKEDQATRS